MAETKRGRPRRASRRKTIQPMTATVTHWRRGRRGEPRSCLLDVVNARSKTGGCLYDRTGAMRLFRLLMRRHHYYANPGYGDAYPAV